jgi:hypothetical protein
MVTVYAVVAWSRMPLVRQSGTPADFARLVLVAIFFLLLPYCSEILFTTESMSLPPLSARLALTLFPLAAAPRCAQCGY